MKTIYNIISTRVRVLLLLLLSLTVAEAQIVIRGSVYGGGNEGVVSGSTSVTVRAGDINKLYGGARMADVKGSAFVNIDGANASNYIVANYVYGGNDIAGTIGRSDVIPTDVQTDAAANDVDNTWNAFVRISSKTIPTTGTDPNQKIYIGQLFGGGNGDYDYSGKKANGKYDVTIGTTTYQDVVKPELAKTFLDIRGGSIVYAYGGGNNATVTQRTMIYLDNPTAVVNSITDANNPNADNTGELLNNSRFENKMGVNTTYSYPESDAYQIGRLFGGNNKATMAIRPRWNLQQGAVRDLYGGGNEGHMTTPEGLLLQVEGAGMRVDNVYGGCRKADVHPLYDNDINRPVAYADIQLDPSDNPNNIPGGYAARVRILAGNINNVYGGNDISGNVYGGNTVGIFTDINKNVYGGGNGSYAYTDNPNLKNTARWGDCYYSPKEILGLVGDTFTGLESAEALNIFRPNAEKVSILVRGTEEKPVMIKGALYVGGNSASLREQVAGGSSGTNNIESATHLKIGSYVTIDSVFLGNNGANMIRYNEVGNASWRNEGVLRTLARTDLTTNNTKFNSMDLNDAKVFEKYMEGCAMKVKPGVLFESLSNDDAADYIHHSSYFGSFFCGGNVGSILVPGKMTINFNHEVVIYDKLVGGCNNARVDASSYNAAYTGGLIGDPDPVPEGSPAGTIGDKLELNLSGLKIEPMRWNEGKTALVLNTQIDGVDCEPVTGLGDGESYPINSNKDTDNKRRLKGGNIYGGCCESGIVNGNVVININATLIDRDKLFDVVEKDDEGKESLYGDNLLNQENLVYHITKRNTGVILDRQGMDVFGQALNVFGGGKGAGTEIWGSTTVNLNKGYVFQVFGGSEEGVIGKTETSPLAYNAAYSCTVNLNGTSPGVSKANAYQENMPECEFIYGGGFRGPIAGNTIVNLGNGRIFNSFAGSCDADILGHTETYMGYNNGFPWVRDIVYGGNDLGGSIRGLSTFSGKSASAYVEYKQGHADAIFGGHFGTYDYSKTVYQRDATHTKPYLDNAFVNFCPISTDALKNTGKGNVVNIVYGGSQGHPGDFDSNKMQERSYVLIDIPQDMTNYQGMKVFGAGAWGGLGMKTKVESSATDAKRDEVSAIVDLLKGQIDAVYGGSYHTGFTRRTVVNVPTGSTIHLNNIFGGAYGEDNTQNCDVYEANVNYSSNDAIVKNAIYGGNNAYRRTLYGRVNINSFVNTGEPDLNGIIKLAKVYGAGYGAGTWSQYTEVNLKDGARVLEAYGGGQLGMVVNKETVKQWDDVTHTDWNFDMDVYTDLGLADNLVKSNSLGIAEDTWQTGKFNTNVYINEGAIVDDRAVMKSYGPGTDGGYAYAGGLGDADIDGSGDVYGTTYIGLFGGKAKKDVYAAGTVGNVMNKYVPEGATNYFTAKTYAFVEGGTCRNVYGGGWQGSVGKHQGENVSWQVQEEDENGNLTTKTVTKYVPSAGTDLTGDVLGESHVVIGIRPDLREAQKPTGLGALTFTKGVPAIERNAYSGGEGGAIFGTAHLTMNNGYIGYRFFKSSESAQLLDTLSHYTTTDGYYEEKIHDETHTDGVGKNRLDGCGSLYGAGYDDLSSCDFTDVKMFGGIVRNSVHGGGEIATVGRGKTKATQGVNRDLEIIYKPGKTHVEMYNGHVLRNVFGGGKGYNDLKYGKGAELYTDGYVFGQTEVFIRGGEIGTTAGVAKEYGNVFGGGDVGYVYSRGYLNDAKTGNTTNLSRRTETGSPGHYYYYYNNTLSEDCKVVVEPYLQVADGKTVSYDSKTYKTYDYVPTTYLNTLGKKTAVTITGVKDWPDEWKELITEEGTGDNQVDRGITIHNAVFAGGNVSTNRDKTYANATTVFGNVTATLNDVYHRDFISVGTEHTGGLYGGGNFSMVDGYRELNITNYGTDYFSLDQQIDLATYRALSNRERAYFKLRYECINTITFHAEGQTDSREYKAGEKIEEDVYLRLVEKYGSQVESAFTTWGFCSIYAGRLLNTIQRADFCGVFGSRMVLQGAKDRVAETEQNTDYTINRVGEVSLNKERSVISGDTGNDAEHGNYFGIYSVVNYMGNLTSDEHFYDPYVGSVEAGSGKTYYGYKADNPTNIKRNKATCKHQVALASGVHLELTTENSTDDHKDYGYITGVVELDLINVKKDKVMGGGFVYAKNEHRVPKYYPAIKNVLLSDYNQKENDDAITYKRFCYEASQVPAGTSDTGAKIISGGNDAYETKSWQTSGNFIHNEKTIVDDCYPINNAYTIGVDPYSEAHYWYVKGEVYVYDQIVTAYTGSASAYQKESQLNLTITAASNGRLQLLNVKPNLYAYYMPKSDTDATGVKIGSRGDNDGNPIDHVTVNNEHDTYKLNDVITWWDWHQLNETERAYFVTETYVNCVAIKVTEGGVTKEYKAGEYVLCDDNKAAVRTLFTNGSIKDADGNTIKDSNNNDATFDYVFRSSNNISHDQGYVLTFDMTTPPVWGKYYTAGDRTMTPLTQQTKADGYLTAPTYYPTTSGVYGRQSYEFGDIITKNTYDAYSSQNGVNPAEHLEPVYVATKAVTYTYSYTDENSQTVTKTVTTNKGNAVPKEKITAYASGSSASDLAQAKMCINTVKLADGIYLGYGELKTAAEITALKAQYAKKYDENNVLIDDPDKAKAIDDAMTDAYFCNTPGTFGGQQFNNTTNYDVISAWCGLSQADRTAGGFTFNKDALDLLASPAYLSLSTNPEKFPAESATETAYGTTYSQRVPIEYEAICKEAFTSTGSVAYAKDQKITSAAFEALPNDQRHYTRVDLESTATKAYIVIDNFTYNGVPYGKGQIVDIDTYSDLNDNNTKIVEVTFANAGNTYYYHYENYDGDTHDQVIDEDTYNSLPNDQKHFIIQGMEPVETSTLYVSSESDIRDVSQERVYTVVYQYTYYEDEDNNNVKFTNELHVINVHVQMESGVPIIGPLAVPDIVIPGDPVNMTPPDVTVGSYPPLGNGWEIFDNEQDAKLGRNGVPYVNGETPLYWYQNGDYYINFYSKNYLGKMYSKPVALRVANYHDLQKVMDDKAHHYYIDNTGVERDPKIYINDYSSDGQNGLDLLKDLFTLSTGGSLDGHAALNTPQVGACKNLEFILRTDIDHTGDWAGIGTNNTTGCFEGMLHGDGHTISGLQGSLFNHLCGEVYNLGVTGTFTSSGIVENGTGYLENCWVKKTNAGTVTSGTKALFGNTTDTESRTVHLVNCYYPTENGYTAQTGATEKPLKAFYNGEVAYDLNDFYLFKRYSDQKTLSGTDTYNYYKKTLTNTEGEKTNDNGTLSLVEGARYEANGVNGRTGPYLLNDNEGHYIGSYVEWRYADGDFMYAGGSVPTVKNERVYTDADKNEHYYPVWPDDYLFFGQALNYNAVDGLTHQDEPSAVNKFGGRLIEDETGNRVFRAPAYFGDKTMGMAHFNPYAVFAKAGYEKGMTAIDFSGGNGDVSGGYLFGAVAATETLPARFCPPLLDDDGIEDFTNVDMTRNLLVYTSPTASTKTESTVSTKLIEDSYQNYETNSTTYHTVAEADNLRQLKTIRGHWVTLSGSSYVANRDHFLIDKETFNAPISYKFGEDYRMWYQRLPQNYVGKRKESGTGFIDKGAGWEGVSLPFTAEIVTTDTKGEITHFYNYTEGSEDHTKGHEYWLREFTGGAMKTGSSDIFEATFSKPAAGTATKEFTNTFLWDYYYKHNDYNDANSDKYPGSYYSTSHTYTNYPRLAGGTPYIIGFPGERYYEFDLSGAFEAKTALITVPEKLNNPQVITFASAKGATIGVSDTDLAAGRKTAGDYTFVPNYAGETLGSTAYILNTDATDKDKQGSSYDVTSTTENTLPAVPFRPYFMLATNVPAVREKTRSIVFSNDDSQLEGDDDSDPRGKSAVGLNIYAKRKKIIVESNLRETTEVRILNTTGMTINSFTIEPGEIVETRIYNAGVYIVHTSDDHYNKKLAVR